MNQHLSFIDSGKAAGGKPGSEPDSGNPTVRDRRGACGNVGYGEKGQSLRYRKRVNGSISPKVKCAVFLSRPSTVLRGAGAN